MEITEGDGKGIICEQCRHRTIERRCMATITAHLENEGRGAPVFKRKKCGEETCSHFRYEALWARLTGERPAATAVA